MNEGMRSCGRPSRGRYAQGCRCRACRAANTDYEYDRARGVRRTASPDQTARARRLVRSWQARGFGLRRIAAVTGVCRSALQTLVNGNHPNCNGLPTRMKWENYVAIVECGVRNGVLTVCNPMPSEHPEYRLEKRLCTVKHDVEPLCERELEPRYPNQRTCDACLGRIR